MAAMMMRGGKAVLRAESPMSLPNPHHRRISHKAPAMVSSVSCSAAATSALDTAVAIITTVEPALRPRTAARAGPPPPAVSSVFNLFLRAVLVRSDLSTIVPFTVTVYMYTVLQL